MMELNEIIASLLDQAQDRDSSIDENDPDCIFRHDAAALRAAVELLKKTHEPNEPLTLDELRQMDGEPVFLKSLGEDFEDQYYIIVSTDKKRLHCLMLYCSLEWDQYSKTWLAYRRRPEEV